MGISLALIAALAFAVASVMQQHAAMHASVDTNESTTRLLLHLVRNRVWLLGTAADLGAYGLQAAALAFGQLSLVQPILTLGLVFALPLSARIQHRRHGRLEWAAAAAVALGVGVFVVVAQPSGATTSIDRGDWIAAFALFGAPALAFAFFSRVTALPRRRAELLALAATLTYGLTAAMTKATVDRLSVGIGATLSSWYPYGVIVGGYFGLVLIQRAFQVAPLSASLPLLTVCEPVVGVALGVLLFEEHLSIGGARLVTIVASLSIMAVGVIVMSTAHEAADRVSALPD